jgi:5-methyltetrahydrofolate--homocysteine methyltransferase
MADLTALTEAVEAGNRTAALAATQAAIDDGGEPGDILDAMSAAMATVGSRFQRNEIFVPEMLISARAMKEATALLEPLLVAAGVAPEHTAVIGTVKGDLHDIGKNLVAAMLEGGGFEIIDLGVDVTPEKFIGAVKEKGANVIALSALLTTTMPSMKTTIEGLKEAGVRSQVKVIIGGAPVTQKYADEIGADGYSDNASAAVALARKLVA